MEKPEKSISTYQLKMILQVQKAKKNGRPIYTLPMKTQEYYRRNKKMVDNMIKEGKKEDKKYIEFTRKQGRSLEQTEIEEVNAVGNLDGGEGPVRKATIFRKKEKKKTKKEKKAAVEETEMSTVSKTACHTGKLKENIFDQIDNILNEVSYRAYKEDESVPTKKKFNNSLKTIHKGLSEIEKVVEHNIKLKTEFNLKDPFWKTSRQRLGQISEKMTRISNRLRELSK